MFYLETPITCFILLVYDIVPDKYALNFLNTNILGTVKILEACKKNKIKNFYMQDLPPVMNHKKTLMKIIHDNKHPYALANI